MELNSARTAQVFDNVYCFESYGVKVQIESNSPSVLAKAVETSHKALVGNVKPARSEEAEHCFRLEVQENGECFLIRDGQWLSAGQLDWKFYRFFDSMVRILVAEFAPSVVFLHAGVVGWRGKAILVPGKSFSGKTSLVFELIKSGADYYSDEYAVLDADGLVHPFARDLSVRVGSGFDIWEKDVPPRDVAANVGNTGISAGFVLFSEYDAGGIWNPEFLSLGKAVVEMVNYTIPIRQKPGFSMEVLQKTLSSCKIVKSPRGDASVFVPFFLEFVDKTVF